MKKFVLVNLDSSKAVVVEASSLSHALQIAETHAITRNAHRAVAELIEK